MTLAWDSLPLLPLRCILDHLSTEDALEAMSTCRHWRNAVLLYEGRKETLKLRAKQMEKNLFLTRIFRRHTRKLNIYIDCNEADLEKFMNFVLPQFFDTAKLQELIFIGPSYIQQSHHVPFVKLKRIITESLVFKHLHCLQKLALMGCGIGTLKNENERYSHKHIEYYSRPLKFSSVQSPADALLSSGNKHLMQSSSLNHLIVDYDQINTAALETLSHLTNFRHLTVNITNKRTPLQPVDWHRLQHSYKHTLQLTVNIIAVPCKRFNDIMENVLVEGLSLISLKVMFCKSLYTPLLSHVSRLYQSTLQEVLWADSPYESTDPYHRIVRPLRHPQPDTYAHVNPFVLLCWQCVHLRRLVIHGYWVWQYDLLGFVRLRKSLSHLEVSAIYNKEDKFNSALQLSEEGSVRVLCCDSPATVDDDYIQEVNEYTEFKWKPTPWNKLHPALRGRSTPAARADYVVSEARRTGVTYKELFSGGLGRYTGGKASLRVREGATPVFHRARPLPYALRERIDAELDAMLRDGVIEPVECSDWASPLVPVNKADGSLRICADYKATVNPALIVDRYPLPRIEDLIVRLGNSCYFSKIDLSQAYNQVELDSTKKFTVINTHRGLYQYNRLVYGLASSAGIFQRIMCNLLGNIPNVEVFLDDVVIGGQSRIQHLQAIETVFSRLHKYGFKLKSSKCVFLVNQVRYLGYVLSKDGITTDPSKIEAISKIPTPVNVGELRSFLGLINFYAKFVKNMSSKLVPLYDLLKRDRKWYWSKDCECAFKEIKRVLTSAEVLAHYDPKRPLIVTCDASARGVGGVLSQPSEDGTYERPVAYASRTLNDAEKNYSQIHREALAIIFSVNKFHQYLYGRHFLLRTDHKPLVSILGPHTGIPTMVASRMQRWAIILSAYSFDIEYVRTDKNGADGLSRLPIMSKQMTHNIVPEQTFLHFVQQELLLDYNEVKTQTIRDPILSKVLSYVRDGWPIECEVINLRPYFNRSKELYEELGCVMWGHRLVVPEACRRRVLGLIHEPHMGIVKSKSLARSYVWWAGMDEAIEGMCRECAVCAAQADAPPRQTPRMWPWPSRPWSRLHLDFMGPILGKTYLVVVDATSKWIEVFHVPSTAASGVVDKMTELFSRWGLPRQIVSDNGPPFTSVEFNKFTTNLGIEHIFTAPYHPASNGLAENAVKSLKRVIKKASLEGQNINKALGTYLLHYRNTEHSTTGESPAMLLVGRRLRTKLDILKPDRGAKVFKAQQRQTAFVEGANRQLDPQQEVWYRQYLKGEKWVPGEVVECTGPSNYRVRGEEGEVIHRHIDQLKKRSSRLSLACASNPKGEVEQSSTNSHREVSDAEPKSSLVQVQPERNPVEGLGTPNDGVCLEGKETAGAGTPTSPEFQDALPTVSPLPRPRHIRQCRIRNKIDYKT